MEAPGIGHIDLSMKYLLEIGEERHVVKQGCLRIEVYEEVNVAPRGSFPSSDRTEYAGIPGVVGLKCNEKLLSLWSNYLLYPQSPPKPDRTQLWRIP